MPECRGWEAGRGSALRARCSARRSFATRGGPSNAPNVNHLAPSDRERGRGQSTLPPTPPSIRKGVFSVNGSDIPRPAKGHQLFGLASTTAHSMRTSGTAASPAARSPIRNTGEAGGCVLEDCVVSAKTTPWRPCPGRDSSRGTFGLQLRHRQNCRLSAVQHAGHPDERRAVVRHRSEGGTHTTSRASISRASRIRVAGKVR